MDENTEAKLLLPEGTRHDSQVASFGRRLGDHVELSGLVTTKAIDSIDRRRVLRLEQE
jgi:hypothetical protein